jgi:hypothetical protein
MQHTLARQEDPFFNLTSTGDEFESALKRSVRENARSMGDLRVSIRNCMISLRADGMQCEQAILTMKAFVRDSCLRHKRRGSREMLHCEMLMEQIVGWCITEYYTEP